MDAPGSILRRRGLKAKKRWGQNFLGDAAVLERIAAAARVGPGDVVVELGAGLGHLTQALLDTGAAVIAVERDRDMIAALRSEFADRADLTLVEGNAATLSLRELRLPPGVPVTVVGNLPYQLSSAILFAMLAQRAALTRLIFLLQEEFVARLAAGPGGRDFGVLSVQAQAVAEVRRLFGVPASAFHPAPAVDSAVVELLPLRAPRVAAAATALFAQVVRGAFQQRRKTLANALTGAGLAQAKVALVAAGLDPQRRAETLTLEDFGKLTEAFDRLGVQPAATPGERRPATRKPTPQRDRQI